MLANFVPPEDAHAIERRAEWSDENAAWALPREELTTNALRKRLGHRTTSQAGLRRPETEYARHRKQYDPATRYKSENVINMELDAAERVTQEYEGPEMQSRVDKVLGATLDDDEELVTMAGVAEPGPPYPYQFYTPEEAAAKAAAATEPPAEEKKSSKSRSKSGKSRSSREAKDEAGGKKSRPKTARRKRADEEIEIGGDPY